MGACCTRFCKMIWTYFGCSGSVIPQKGTYNNKEELNYHKLLDCLTVLPLKYEMLNINKWIQTSTTQKQLDTGQTQICTLAVALYCYTTIKTANDLINIRTRKYLLLKQMQNFDVSHHNRLYIKMDHMIASQKSSVIPPAG